MSSRFWLEMQPPATEPSEEGIPRGVVLPPVGTPPANGSSGGQGVSKEASRHSQMTKPNPVQLCDLLTSQTFRNRMMSKPITPPECGVWGGLRRALICMRHLVLLESIHRFEERDTLIAFF